MFSKLLQLSIIVSLSFCSFAEAATVRVAVVEKQQTLSLQAEKDFLVTEVSTGEVKEIPKGKYFLHSEGKDIFLDDKLHFRGTLRIDGIKGYDIPLVNGRHYPGSYNILIEQDKLTLVNNVDLEEYLCQILPAKTMVVWPEEAIKAQAVAARSYALFHMKSHEALPYDLSANDEELPYIGITKYTEKKAVSKLIKATKGEYQADYWGNPILGLTTSSTGGKTSGSAQVLGVHYSYLVPVDDYDSDSPEYTWENRIAPVLIQSLLEQRGYKIGKLNSVRLSSLQEPGMDRTQEGRVKYIVFAGDLGSARINGQELVKLLSLNSDLFQIETGTPIPESLKVPIVNGIGMEIGSKEIPIKVNEGDKHVWSNLRRSIHMLNGNKDERITFKGQGKGSGLGLSAWGARGLVNEKAGTTYEKVLEYYYPGTHLVK